MRHIVLLRGINLGSRNRVSMPELRAVLTDAGFEDVRTYLQSGNVALTSDPKPHAGSASPRRRGTGRRSRACSRSPTTSDAAPLAERGADRWRDLRPEQLDRAQRACVREVAEARLQQEAVVCEELVLEEDLPDNLL